MLIKTLRTWHSESHTTSTEESELLIFNYSQDYLRPISHLIQTVIIEKCGYKKRA